MLATIFGAAVAEHFPEEACHRLSATSDALIANTLRALGARNHWKLLAFK